MASKKQLRFLARNEAKAHGTPGDRYALTADDLDATSDVVECEWCGEEAFPEVQLALRQDWYDPVTGQDLLRVARVYILCSESCREMWLFGP